MAAVFLFSLLLASIRVLLSVPAVNEGMKPALDYLGGRSDVSEDYNRDRSSDEEYFYVPAIRQSYRQWPKADLELDARTHKPPGYPFLMATAARIMGLNFTRLRVLQMLLSAAIPALLYRWLRTQRSALTATAIVAPLVCSSFFIKSSAYLTTDNVAFLCVAAALYFLVQARWTAWSATALALLNSAAVCVRQDTVWLVGPASILLALQVWRGRRTGQAARTEFSIWRCLILVGAIIGPIVILVRLWWTWHGFVPPGYYTGLLRTGPSLAPVAYILALVAIFWWPYLIAAHGFRAAAKLAIEKAALGWALGGLALVLTIETTYKYGAGRWGGYLWLLASIVPAVGGRSLVFLFLAPLGALALGITLRKMYSLQPTAAVVFGVSFAAWASSSTLNPYVFHRYYEPGVLLFLIAASAMTQAQKASASLTTYVPLVVVSGVQLAISVTTLYFSMFFELRR